MLDWTRVTGFEWDEGNARKSSDKHGVSQAEAEQTFFNASLRVVSDVKHSAEEPRYHALGETDEGRRLHITFTLRSDGTLIRVVSARDMHRKERKTYDDIQTEEPEGTREPPHNNEPEKGGSGVQE
jgi:uncharacterized protein